MVGFIGGRSSAFDYIGPDLPSNPQNGEMWFDTDGGSDGTGEVKVYDGANGAWEATGFTSHADLTDVTRGAHHPPVSVNGPLTQPSDQTLGLSIGNGLANSSGTLVAALGNGLGIDANGQIYVPSGSMVHGSEVDAPSDAHHTRYTDLEASNAAPVQSVNGQTGDVTVSTSMGGYVEKSAATGTYTNNTGSAALLVVQFLDSNGSISAWVEYPTGTSYTNDPRAINVDVDDGSTNGFGGSTVIGPGDSYVIDVFEGSVSKHLLKPIEV